MGTRANYKDGTNTEVGGPVVRAEKQAAGTVYVIRVLDDEVAAFVPARLVQPAFGPGKILVLRGVPHKQDARKFWASGLDSLEEPIGVAIPDEGEPVPAALAVRERMAEPAD